MLNRFPLKAAYAVSLFAALAGNALAADGWKVRFPLSGTLGGEIAAPIGAGGLYGEVSVTQLELDKLAGPDGNNFQLPTSGTIPVPLATINPALGTRSASYSGVADVGFKQSQTQINSVIRYLTKEEYNGGRLAFAVNIPVISINRTTTLTGATPTLGTISPSLTGSGVSTAQAAGIQAATQAKFAAANGYQAGLTSQAATLSGTQSGIGDIEVSGAWVYQDPVLKVVAATTLALPTAQWDPVTGLNLGFGKFYTLRPSVIVAYNATPDWTLGARTSVAFNTRNTDNNIKSGNFYGIDLAAAYRTSLGVVGPHLVFVNQYEDDDGGKYGPNRFSTSGAGVFFATKIPSIDMGLNLSYMQSFDARNALSGSFIQVRLTKAF